MAAVPKLAGLRLRQLLLFTWKGIVSDDIVNRAAELAFWFLLGFFPMLLSATSIVSMIGSAPGSQGSLVILMIWFYLSGIAILVGGEINAILEDSAAEQKVPGAKRRGQRSLAKISN